MYIVNVIVKVKPEAVDAFIEAIRLNHEGTRQEPGNLRFDVSQAEDTPTQFLLYEVYHTKADFAAHQQTAHFLKWRETAADMMAEPRTRMSCYSLFPTDQNW
jgi:autoinducer 2-degrading protein